MEIQCTLKCDLAISGDRIRVQARVEDHTGHALAVFPTLFLEPGSCWAYGPLTLRSKVEADELVWRTVVNPTSHVEVSQHG